MRFTIRLLICCLALALPASAAAATRQAASGQVSATASWTGTAGSYSAIHMSITRAGAPFEFDVSSPECQPPICSPGPAPILRALDLDGDGEPEVLLNLFTGGAHCCSLADVIAWDGTTYVEHPFDFADPGYRLKNLDGRGAPEFLTADARFAYRFASFASSGMPVLIERFGRGKLVDVTRSFPARIRSDARLWWSYWLKWPRTRSPEEARGALAAWAADEYRLRRRAYALMVMRAAADSKKLRGGRAWVTSLDRWLRRRGY